jgi:hypothetical protein
MAAICFTEPLPNYVYACPRVLKLLQEIQEVLGGISVHDRFALGYIADVECGSEGRAPYWGCHESGMYGLVCESLRLVVHQVIDFMILEMEASHQS